MSLLTKILLIWAAFNLVMYLIMWYDCKEHTFHIKETIRSIKDSFTQDE